MTLTLYLGETFTVGLYFESKRVSILNERMSFVNTTDVTLYLHLLSFKTLDC